MIILYSRVYSTIGLVKSATFSCLYAITSTLSLPMRASLNSDSMLSLALKDVTCFKFLVSVGARVFSFARVDDFRRDQSPEFYRGFRHLYQPGRHFKKYA